MPTDPKQNEVKQETRESQRRTINSHDLFGQHRQIFIKHNDQTYQLQITRQNKLILTK